MDKLLSWFIRTLEWNWSIKIPPPSVEEFPYGLNRECFFLFRTEANFSKTSNTPWDYWLLWRYVSLMQWKTPPPMAPWAKFRNFQWQRVATWNRDEKEKKTRGSCGVMGSIIISFSRPADQALPSLKLTFSLKMDGWNTIVSFWEGLFSGNMLVSGRVCCPCLHNTGIPVQLCLWINQV